MKKMASALILKIVLISTVFITQIFFPASANPVWKPWEYRISYPTIDVTSPAEDGSYPSNDIWLNFTVTKPSDWFNATLHITYVSYCVDGEADGPWAHSGTLDANEVIVYVQGYRGVVNTPSNSSFSFNLTEKRSNPLLSNSSVELKEGLHTVDVWVSWTYNGMEFANGTIETIPFTVYAPTQEPTSIPTPIPTVTPTSTPAPTSTTSATPEATSQQPTFPATPIFVASAGIALGVIGLFVHFKKFRGDKNL